jgi:adenosylcobinamide kinase/adenosylcobinamide-phosphate guanylyltransferase
MARSTFILGGARSGKSRFAQMLAEQSGLTCIYLATAEARDNEMAARIARHRQDRGPHWRTIEAPLDLSGAIADLGHTGSILLVDCLTLWLSNILGAGHDPVPETERLLDALGRCRAETILVSNEVGLGIVPETRLGRDFRDHAGLLHQRVAAHADRVALMVAGLPLWVKGD